jgi:hypothetical protein
MTSGISLRPSSMPADEAAKALALSQEAAKGVQALALELARLAPDRYEITTDADGRPTGIREREVPRD